MESLKGRSVLVGLFVIFCVIYLLPNFVKLPDSWWFHKKPLNYGLDIQGGAHLVYGVDVKGVMQERTERMARAIQQELKEKAVEAATSVTGDKKDILKIEAKSEGDRAKASALLKDQYSTVLQVMTDSGSAIEARYYDAVLQTYREQVIHQAIEVIRNRVDEFGVAEPVIAAQGADRILVQLPGLTDPARAKELINKTARLDFRLVDESLTGEQVAKLVADAEKEGNFALGKEGLTYAQYVKKVNEGLKDKLPPHTMISFEKARSAVSMEAGKIAYLVRTDSDVTGDLLEDAFVSFGEYGEPKVSFRFGTEGRRKFGALTGANVGRNLAIVLDETIYSAPNIRERIDGEGQISLGASDAEQAQKEGQLIATALRAGALPAALEQLEERSVGPSLGADSIAKGKVAGLVGFVMVIIFISIYYKTFGVVASTCLLLNVMGLLAVLSALGATLTLPGIAGITLTMGMAIDANVIIYERIKEELARGSTMKSAIKDGFNHAWSAIFDSNVTTAIAASVLVYFGSGAVRGFGVTLIAGIITTMVTAVFVTHWLLDLVVSMSKDNKVSI
ncbi:MAG: protein translocase subunit SecD [Bdellovibrionales bacterium]